MKKVFSLLLLCFTVISLNACKTCQTNVQVDTQILDSRDFATATAVKDYLIEQNKIYQASLKNDSPLTNERRETLTSKGQKPYCLVLTCADSRVPVEHIFNAGMGEIFVVRNAGNVVTDVELGSIEYAVEHLGIKYILILGHTHCGAVDSTIHHHAELSKEKPNAKLQTILDEVKGAIHDTKDPRVAEKLNMEHSLAVALENPVVQEFSDSVLVEGAIYDITTGAVIFQGE